MEDQNLTTDQTHYAAALAGIPLILGGSYIVGSVGLLSDITTLMLATTLMSILMVDVLFINPPSESDP
jgi:hypothetical protein